MKRTGVTIVLIAVALASGFALSRSLGQPGGEQAATASSDPLAPTTISPRRADIRSVIVLDGIVRPVPMRGIRSPRSGTVRKVLARSGTTVKRRQLLVTLDTPAGIYRVRAPQTGVLASLDVMKGQTVEVGSVIGVVAPMRFLAEANVQPSLLYRFYDTPIEVVAHVDHGPEPFPCPFRSVGMDGSTASDPLSQPVVVRCSIPAAIRVFAGVRVRLAVTTAIAKDALVVPLEAVEGAADRGAVTAVSPTGERTRRSVTLGISDGVRVQILSGLTEDDRLLEFPVSGPPASAAPSPT